MATVIHRTLSRRISYLVLLTTTSGTVLLLSEFASQLSTASLPKIVTFRDWLLAEASSDLRQLQKKGRRAFKSVPRRDELFAHALVTEGSCRRTRFQLPARYDPR
jgi:hypothetical protein